YSRPGPEDRLGFDFDATGRLGVPVLEELGVPRDAEFYVCGPAAFLHGLGAGLAAWGVAATHIHKEIFGPGESMTPGISARPARPHRGVRAPAGAAGRGPRFSVARGGFSVGGAHKSDTVVARAGACDRPVRGARGRGLGQNGEGGLFPGGVRYGLEPLDPPAT